MAGSKTNEFENDVLDWIVGRTPSGHAALGAPGTAHYLALFTTTLTDSVATAGAATEVSGNGYARVQVSATNFATAAASGQIQNTAEISFPAASGGNWGTIESWAIVEGNTGGTNPILVWCDDPSTPVNDGDTLKFAVAAITIQED